jgi:glycyl-tRNA synthetase beta chain
MVGEFPELQGLMGGYYAAAQGEDPQVAEAIRDHYKPVGQGDEVPAAPVTVAVSLADKLDTLAAFFIISERPTGSKDPFALRRACIAAIQLILTNGLRASLYQIARKAAGRHLPYDPKDDRLRDAAERLALISRDYGRPFEMDDKFITDVLANAEAQHLEGSRMVFARRDAAAKELVDFFADRLKVQQREAGVRHDLIDAVFALGNEDDLVRLLSRVNALQSFIKTDDGANLLAAYKRAANILRKEDWKGAEGEIARTGEEDPLALVDDPDLRPVIEAKLADKKKLSYTPEPAEKELIEALDSAEPKAAAAVRAEDFEAAMAALASLRGPIDRFFDSVTVNDDDAAKRSARLDLLGRFRAAVHEVADFSKIEG